MLVKVSFWRFRLTNASKNDLNLLTFGCHTDDADDDDNGVGVLVVGVGIGDNKPRRAA